MNGITAVCSAPATPSGTGGPYASRSAPPANTIERPTSIAVTDVR